MSTSNTSLRVTELDYFGIRENLKTFLKNQEKFSDYNFEGSGMAVLLDLLAYNTYYNSFYMNMIANESFLDTAQDRKNILSHVKVLNYVPESAHGATSKINIKVTPATGENQAINYIVLDRYTRLMGSDVEGVNYPFAAINANTAYKVNGAFTFSNVIIKQGEVMTHQFLVDTANNITGRYEIPSSNVDTDTLIVTVQESASNNQTVQYFPFEDITDLMANSKVYFLEENSNFNYDIYFGDGYLGQNLNSGNIVTVSYLDTSGSYANSIQKFTFTDPVAKLFRSNVKVTVVEGSYGGTDREDIEQIRFRAPYFYRTQNRAVTKGDYSTLITKDFPNIEAASVWGGEENDPPVYGKVYISLKTRGYFILTDLEKNNIKNYLTANRSMMTVIPEIVDPEYVFVLVRGDISYKPALTTKSESELQQIVKDAIFLYAQNELYTFESTFRLSRLQYYIENADPSITASDVQIYLQNRKPISIGAAEKYIINFKTPIRKGDAFQKLYTYPQTSVYDSTGSVRKVYFEEVPQSYTGIDSVSIINAGLDYTVYATIEILGDGTGATVEPVVVNGKIESVKVTNPGTNYSRAVAAITDSFGSEASFAVNLQSNKGTIRSFFYDENGQKFVVNDDEGTIDYLTGKITLNSLKALVIENNPFYDENILTINAVPEKGVIPPSKNRLIAIDTNNAQAIQIRMVPQA